MDLKKHCRPGADSESSAAAVLALPSGSIHPPVAVAARSVKSRLQASRQAGARRKSQQQQAEEAGPPARRGAEVVRGVSNSIRVANGEAVVITGARNAGDGLMGASMASSLVVVPRPRRWAQLGRRAVLCGDSSLIRACLCRRRRGSWGLYALRRQERCHGVSSQNACGRSPVARGRRKGPWQTAVIRPRRSRPYTCDPTAERGSGGGRYFIYRPPRTVN